MYDYFFKIALVAGLLMKEGANSIVRHPLFFYFCSSFDRCCLSSLLHDEWSGCASSNLNIGSRNNHVVTQNGPVSVAIE